MYLRLELIYQHYLTNMKDQHNHKITEHEFTKDIGHGTEIIKTIEELFDEYAGCFRAVDECLLEGEGCNMCVEDKERMQEIIQEVTKQIQSDLLKEVYQRNRNHQPSEDKEKMFRDDLEKLTYICGRVDVVNDIKKLAEEKGIIINK